MSNHPAWPPAPTPSWTTFGQTPLASLHSRPAAVRGDTLCLLTSVCRFFSVLILGLLGACMLWTRCHALLHVFLSLPHDCSSCPCDIIIIFHTFLLRPMFSALFQNRWMKSIRSAGRLLIFH